MLERLVTPSGDTGVESEANFLFSSPNIQPGFNPEITMSAIKSSLELEADGYKRKKRRFNQARQRWAQRKNRP